MTHANQKEAEDLSSLKFRHISTRRLLAWPVRQKGSSTERQACVLKHLVLPPSENSPGYLDPFSSDLSTVQKEMSSHISQKLDFTSQNASPGLVSLIPGHVQLRFLQFSAFSAQDSPLIHPPFQVTLLFMWSVFHGQPYHDPKTTPHPRQGFSICLVMPQTIGKASGSTITNQIPFVYAAWAGHRLRAPHLRNPTGS